MQAIIRHKIDFGWLMPKMRKIVFVFITIIVTILIVPISLNILYLSAITKPIYNNNNHTFFLRYFGKKPSQSLSLYNLRSSKSLIFYLYKQLYRDDIPYNKQQELKNITNNLIVLLQKNYPLDSSLMLLKADILANNEHFSQGYDELQASYYVSLCYASSIRYRIYLKEKYNLFVPQKINIDIKNLKNHTCHS